MNLSQINTYASEFHKQLKKTHPFLRSDDIFAIMAFQFLFILKSAPEYRLDKKINFALKTTAELTYVSLLNNEEFASYIKETQELKDALDREADGRGSTETESVQENIIECETSDVDSTSASDQHSNEVGTPKPHYPY